MSTILLRQATTSTPEQFVAGLTDLGPGRSKLLGSSADEYLKVRHRGPNEGWMEGKPGERSLPGCAFCRSLERAASPVRLLNVNPRSAT